MPFPKGTMLSDEHKLKISNALRGRKISDDHRNRISMAKKGKSSWNKGIPHLEETKRKISIANKGRCRSNEVRLQLSISHKGITHSLETRQKLSKINKGRPVSSETRQKISRAQKGIPNSPCSPETRKKLSETRKGRGYKHSPETREKIRNALKGRIVPIEQRLKNSKAKRPTWVEVYGEDGAKAKRAQVVNYMKHNNPRQYVIRISRPQRQMFEFIKTMYPDAVLEYPVRVDNKSYYLDVAIPDIMIDIEYDGPAWHCEPEKDLKRDNVLESLGWVVIRIKGIENLRSFIGYIPQEKSYNTHTPSKGGT